MAHNGFCKSRYMQRKRSCPLLPRKRTCAVYYAMSAKCQKQTSKCRQLMALMARLVAAGLPLDHVLDGYCSGLFENQRAVDPVALFGGLL